MSLTLTAPAFTRPVTIDLTLSPSPPIQDTPPNRSSQTPKQRRPRTWTNDDVPTPKRRQLEVLGKRQQRSVKDCLVAQVVPVVREATQCLPQSELKVDEIGKRVIVELVKSPSFKVHVDETLGQLTQEYIHYLKGEAKRLVEVYRRDPKHIFKASPKPATPVPPAWTASQSQSLPTTSSSSNPAEGSSASYRDVPIPQSVQRRERVDRPFDPLRLTQRSPLQTTNLHLEPQGRRPYCSVAERQQISIGAQRCGKRPSKFVGDPLVYHVDFSPEEVAAIVGQVCARLGQTFPRTREGLLCLIRSRTDQLHIPSWITVLPPGRTKEDVRLFCSDLLKKRECENSTSSNILSLQKPQPTQRQEGFGTRASTLLLARELEGNAGYGRMRTHVNFQKDFRRLYEDGLDLVATYTDCAGDIDTFAWVSNKAFICGATTHSDPYNQQYNKPGNLLLCSTTAGELKAYPDHRTERPLVDKGENSSESMRQSQDPWIYHSVVASDYDPFLKLAYTASYDKTVKAWKVDDEGHHMECVATWKHDGIVNFVQCAKDGSGRVATASNCVNKPAVRIYKADPDNMPLAPHQELCCTRTDHLESDAKWAYYPATMQWGRGLMAQHLLAVGYSPRADSGHDSDIPEDKLQTGEVTLWDAAQGKRIDISNATTANVFEVVWHPSLPRFACATSRCGTFKSGTRTQVHIFKRDPDREDCYFSTTSLDCPACDINELTYVPNSLDHAYVTAACTDGRVYVWDTAFDSDLQHVLKHGQSLEFFEEHSSERELLDTGVKFTAWGKTLDRFYTGGSDGVVNVWNLQDKQKPFVRKLLPNSPAPIAGGAFSPDRRKLAIGDATGRVWLFSVDSRDTCESHYRTDRLRPQLGRFRGNVPMIPHAEPPPPPPQHISSNSMDIDEIKDSNDTELTPPTSVDERSENEDIIAYCQKLWLDTDQLVYSGERKVGMVQGPNYLASGKFLKEAHIDQDPTRPFTWEYQRIQQGHVLTNSGPRRPSIVRITDPCPLTEEVRKLHIGHQERDAAIRRVYQNLDPSDKSIEELLPEEGLV